MRKKFKPISPEPQVHHIDFFNFSRAQITTLKHTHHRPYIYTHTNTNRQALSDIITHRNLLIWPVIVGSRNRGSGVRKVSGRSTGAGKSRRVRIGRLIDRLTVKKPFNDPRSKYISRTESWELDFTAISRGRVSDGAALVYSSFRSCFDFLLLNRLFWLVRINILKDFGLFCVFIGCINGVDVRVNSYQPSKFFEWLKITLAKLSMCLIYYSDYKNVLLWESGCIILTCLLINIDIGSHIRLCCKLNNNP